MHINIYNDYKDALDEVNRQHDDEALSKIKAELISTHGRHDEAVDTANPDEEQETKVEH